MQDREGAFWFFASLLERYPNISFIFTGSQHLENRNLAYWQILIGKSTARRITFLTENDTMRLIQEPVKDTVSYQKTVPDLFRHWIRREHSIWKELAM